MVVKTKHINHFTHKPAAYEGGCACYLFSDGSEPMLSGSVFYGLPQGGF